VLATSSPILVCDLLSLLSTFGDVITRKNREGEIYTRPKISFGVPCTTVMPPAQSKSKRQKVFQTEKQHSKPTDPRKAHKALHGNSEAIKDFSQNKGLEHRVQDLLFKRKQTKFRIHCTISI